jgi:drug/metabolite transporter (DMT)-like permease
MTPARPQSWRLGIVITCLCFLSFTIFDVCIKWVGDRSPIYETFSLMTGVAVLMLGLSVLARRQPSLLKTSHLKLHALRGAMNFILFILAIFALQNITLANYYALAFVIPMYVITLSALIFKDRPGWQRWVATMCGFAGILIVLRPTMAIGIGMLAAIAKDILWTLDTIFMRHTNSKDSSTAVMFYLMLFALPWGLIMMIFDYHPLSAKLIGAIVLAGLFLGMAYVALAEGFRLAGPSLAAPFHYTQLLWGIPLGYFIWHEIPDAYTWIGGAVIVASGLYLLRHEARVEKVTQ